MPKVTVLMAIYNGERFLREAIESILGQTFKDFEFLIVNDGSTDGSREIILSYNDPRIRLVDNWQNCGLTQSLNRGLKLAEGEFIARQDADDVSEPERLAKQVAFLERHTEVALLGTWYKEIDAQGAPLGDGKLPCDCTEIRWCLFFFCPFVHSSIMLRKSVVTRIGFYNEALAYSADYELWSRIAHRLPVANLSEYLIKWRINPFSMTATYGPRVQEGHQIRIGNIVRLLGWDETGRVESNEPRFLRMTSLLFDSQTNLDPQVAMTATAEIFRLHTAFCQYYRIDRIDCRTHRTRLCSHVSRRLIEIAHHSTCQGDYAAARHLFLRACRLHWSIPFTKRHVRFTSKLLLGPHLLRALKSFTQKGKNE